jgi:putative spermidine/putrescine transport system substrate-binding protein
MKRRTVLTAAIVLSIALAAFFFFLAKANRGSALTVVTWTGNYGRAQANAQMIPFARAIGAGVRIAEYDGGTAEIARAVATKAYDWDVIDMELPDAVAACRAGLLERIDAGALPRAPDGRAAVRDFLPGAVGPCWAASVVYSRIVAFDARRFSGEAPATLADVFDAKKFPGSRALPRTAKYNLEMALLADGVPPGEIYETLSTPAGIVRALGKLDALGSDLVFPAEGDAPLKMVLEGRAAFAAAFNGDVFEVPGHGAGLGVVWDRQLYEFDVLAVARGNPRRNLAMDYIRFATSAKTLGALASWLPYGPARLSAQAFVGANPDLKIAMTPFQPTAGGRFVTAFAVDDAWWRLHGADVDVLWQAWLAKRP